MENKPALLLTGRTKMTLIKFPIKNVKENELHYNNQQIRQCAFLGALRLKPIPSIFCKQKANVSCLKLFPSSNENNKKPSLFENNIVELNNTLPSTNQYQNTAIKRILEIKCNNEENKFPGMADQADDNIHKGTVNEPVPGKDTKSKASGFIVNSGNIKLRKPVNPMSDELVSLLDEQKPVVSPKIPLTTRALPKNKASLQTEEKSKSPVKHKTPETDELANSNHSNTTENESLKDKTNFTSSSTSPKPKTRQMSIRDMFKGAALKTENSSEPKIVDKTKDENVLPPVLGPQARIGGLTVDHFEMEGRLNSCPKEDKARKQQRVPNDPADYNSRLMPKQGFRCKVCLILLPSYYLLNKHKLQHVKTINPYSCPQCVQVFPTVLELSAHIRIHKGKQPYVCKKCHKGFWSKASLESHGRIHILKKVVEPKKKFRCDVCAKEFTKISDMERHILVHTGEKSIICNICNKRFQHSQSLNKHLSSTHLNVKPYRCDICNKSFARPDVLNRHVLTHSVEKPFQCKDCPKNFIRINQLENHRRKHHPNSKSVIDDDKKQRVVNPIAV